MLRAGAAAADGWARSPGLGTAAWQQGQLHCYRNQPVKSKQVDDTKARRETTASTVLTHLECQTLLRGLKQSFMSRIPKGP